MKNSKGRMRGRGSSAKEVERVNELLFIIYLVGGLGAAQREVGEGDGRGEEFFWRLREMDKSGPFEMPLDPKFHWAEDASPAINVGPKNKKGHEWLYWLVAMISRDDG